MEKAKVALIQFQLSPPKTDMENQVVINDYSQMDRVLKEERAYTLNLVKGPVVKLLIHLSLFNQSSPFIFQTKPNDLVTTGN